jgi:GNAT superfamily N-acetyltransferase
MSRRQILIRPADQPGDLGWVVMAHGEVYAKEYGWDTSFERLVAQIVTNYAINCDPTREAAWIAELDGHRVGCVFCVAGDEDTAKLRILLVTADARRGGAGAQLVDTCMDFARKAGYVRMRLWTNDVLVAARQLYLSRGFALIEQEPHRSYGADLIGQTYEVAL